jgi:NAD+ synthetase
VKVALAQINCRVADFRENVGRIRDFAARAEKQGAELVVFPEQCLGGYPALDLWESPEFIAANERCLRDLAKGTGEMGLLLGFVTENPKKVGKPILNAAALLHKGKVAALRAKTLLPTYDVFDEARYFEPAASNAPILFKGRRLAVSICEDAWSAQRVGQRRLYARDPLAEQLRAGADLLINISASPFIRGKTAARLRMLRAHAKRAKRPLLYCNLAGANDEIVFDGNSLALDSRGRPVAKARAWGEDIILIDTEKLGSPLKEPLFAEDVEEVAEALGLGLKDYLRKCGFEKVFVGLSGGIDSAVVCALAVRALGRERVTGVSMPSPYSSEHSRTDALALAENLGIRFLTLPITDVFDAYRATLAPVFAGSPEGLAEQNLQARIRGALLMALSNKEGGLVLSTGNKSELAVGYCTLYGDMCGGLALLADAPKGTIYELARFLNKSKVVIPRGSIEKPPSAELRPNQRDQDDLPPYDVVDGVLKAYIEERLGAGAIARLGYQRKVVDDLLARMDRSEYKRRQAPPGIKISAKAFGVGRRMPIARYSE